MKTLTNKNIEETFVELLNECGKTTSKDVKEKLREKDFYALQSVVSDVLKNVYEIFGAEREYNGQYFLYKKNVKKDSYKKKKICEISSNSDEDEYLIKIQDEENNITNVIISKHEIPEYQYEVMFDGHTICYVSSNDKQLTREQVRYYAISIFKNEIADISYTNIKCLKRKD